LALLRLVDPFWVMSKGVSTAAAAISIYNGCSYLVVSDGAHTASPPLQDFTLTTRAVGRTIFAVTLDIWQFQDNNGHGKLPEMAVGTTTIVHGACHFYIIQPDLGQLHLERDPIANFS
jgi:hypothetical protein